MGGAKKRSGPSNGHTLEGCDCPALQHCKAIQAIIRSAPVTAISGRPMFKCPMVYGRKAVEV